MSLTLSVAGKTKVSPANTCPSTVPLVGMSFTTKYLASLKSSADILAGSRVKVAENRSFWQDGSRFSSMWDREGGGGIQAGDSSSKGPISRMSEVGLSSEEELEDSEDMDDGGRVANRTRASQSWKDCVSKRSASSIT